jgi:hypothetical protein
MPGLVEMKRYTITVQVQVFAESEWVAKNKGLERLYDMLDEDCTRGRPFNLDVDCVEE